MTAYLLIDHLLSFMMPAAAVAVLLVLLNRLWGVFFKSKGALVQAFAACVAIIFVVNMVVLGVGLLVFGRDGMMATYAAMVLCAALALTLLQRGSKR